MLRFFTLYTLYQKGDSHTHKHNKAITHSVGGWLQCLDMECEDVRVSSRQREQRKQQGCFGDFWLFPSVWEDGCDNGYLVRRTKKAAPSGEGRILLRWRIVELMDTRTHTNHIDLLSVAQSQSPSRLHFYFVLFCLFRSQCQPNTPLWPQTDEKKKSYVC